MHPLIRRWSTEDVAPSQRFAYYSEALSTALTPMLVSAPAEVADAFRAETRSAMLGSIAVLRQTGEISTAYRGAAEIARSAERSFHLIVNLIAPWDVEHRGRVRLAPGDAIFTDSNFGHFLDLPRPYECVNLKFTEEWVRQWVPVPAVLTGRTIPARAPWARALTAFVSQLTPEFVVSAPLPHAVLADQVGALLALVATEMSATRDGPSRPVRDVRARIQDLVTERCSDPELSASVVAAVLGVSPRTVHRVLAACGTTFGAQLMDARVALALRMLESPLFHRVTTAEIGRRAGFSDASHFVRVVRSRCKRTPLQVRRDAGIRSDAERASPTPAPVLPPG